MRSKAYNRQFNQLLKTIPSQFSGVCCVSDCVSLRLGGMDSIIVGHDYCMGFTLEFGECVSEAQSIQIVRCEHESQYSHMQGIHVQDTDLDHLVDQIQVALRDGFTSIFVHSIATKGGVK